MKSSQSLFFSFTVSGRQKRSSFYYMSKSHKSISRLKVWQEKKIASFSKRAVLQENVYPIFFWVYQNISILRRRVTCFFCIVYPTYTKTNSYTFSSLQIYKSLQDFFIFAFRFWTFNIREGQCYLKFGRGGLRPNDERGVFVSGSTRDDGCSKFYQKKLLWVYWVLL